MLLLFFWAVTLPLQGAGLAIGAPLGRTGLSTASLSYCSMEISWLGKGSPFGRTGIRTASQSSFTMEESFVAIGPELTCGGSCLNSSFGIGSLVQPPFALGLTGLGFPLPTPEGGAGMPLGGPLTISFSSVSSGFCGVGYQSRVKLKMSQEGMSGVISASLSESAQACASLFKNFSIFATI